MIANRFTSRAMLLKGDLSMPGFETPSTAPTMNRIPTGLPLPSGSGLRSPPPGLPLPKGAGPRRPPPGLPLPKGPGPRCPPPGLPLPKGAGPRRPPPGLPLPMGVGLSHPPPGLPTASENGSTCPTPDSIGDTVTQLRASIVGCHRETVRRETGLDSCPSSNLHYFVQQSPHSRHEYIPPTAHSSLSQSNYT